MTFTVGETVVYPNHGAAVIEDIETRQIKGEDREYLVLRIVAQQDLVVRVPACNLDLVGVRDVVDKDGLDRVFDVLRAAHTEEPTNWSRRYKANLEKLHSGDVMKVAEVVRDLWRRLARSWSPSWRWPSTPTRTRPRRCSTRSSPRSNTPQRGRPPGR
jgi:CarD family transcriptional regulator